MLQSLEIEHFRCIDHASLDFDQHATAICGDNGSGKTSLLEAIFFLGHARSFRTNAREHLLARGAEFLRIVGRLSGPATETVVGAEFAGGQTKLRLDGRTPRSAAELAQVLPLQIIDPSVHRLIEEGSARRRRALDWGVFHVKHEFMASWRRYQRALEQRNAALRAHRAAAEVTAWDAELASAGGSLDAARREYLGILESHLTVLSGSLCSGDASVDYSPGWPADMPLADALEKSWERDRRLATTTVGPHRADLRFKRDGQLARDVVSRGEQKMLALAFILAQVRCLAHQRGTQTCLLLDDPGAELDVDNLGKLLGVISRFDSQLIVTAVDQVPLRYLEVNRVFHVKQGQFNRVL